jgi:hypothetical protein
MAMNVNADRPLIELLESWNAGLSPDWLARARQFRAVRDVPLGELGTHPDLGERLEQVVGHLHGVEVGIYYRFYAARVQRRVFALAPGMRNIKFCVGAGHVARACKLGAEADPELGGDWVHVDAWNSDVRTAVWLETLETLATMAFEHVSRA